MAEHDPKTSPARIIRYNKNDSDEKQTVVKVVKGKAATIRELHRLRSEEPEPEKYAYTWTWVNRSAAREYDEEQAGIKSRKAKRKKSV